jgi:uncharacterized membrane protein
MKTNVILCSAIAALLLPAGLRAQPIEPEPVRPVRPDWEQLREELRNMPPEERRERMRQWREQSAAWQGAAEDRPFANQPRFQAPGMAVGAAGGVGRVFMVLTPEQRESLREVSEADREKFRELQEQLRAARQAAAEAGIAAEFNEPALREKLEAAAKLDTELAILRARALSKIEPPLSDEQIHRLKNPPPAGEALRDRAPGRIQQPPPGDVPRRGDLPPVDRPAHRPPPRDGQLPPPEQF